MGERATWLTALLFMAAGWLSWYGFDYLWPQYPDGFDEVGFFFLYVSSFFWVAGFVWLRHAIAWRLYTWAWRHHARYGRWP